MKSHANKSLRDGAKCKVIGGARAGKSGVVKDINTSKMGHITNYGASSDDPSRHRYRCELTHRFPIARLKSRVSLYLTSLPKR